MSISPGGRRDRADSAGRCRGADAPRAVDIDAQRTRAPLAWRTYAPRPCVRHDAVGVSRGVRGDGDRGRAVGAGPAIARARRRDRVSRREIVQVLGDRRARRAVDLQSARIARRTAGHERAVSIHSPPELRRRRRRTDWYGADHRGQICRTGRGRVLQLAALTADTGGRTGASVGIYWPRRFTPAP